VQAFAIEACENVVAWLVWPVLLHSLWFGLVAASLVALVFQTCKRLSHDTRYVLLCVSLVATVLGPSVVAISLCATAREPRASAIARSTGVTVTEKIRPHSDARSSSPAPFESVLGVSDSRRGEATSLSAVIASVVEALRQARRFLVAAWLLGLAASVAFLVVGSSVLHRLTRESDPASEGVEKMAGALARRLRMKKAPPVLIHSSIQEPCLTGLVRPAILLPRRWTLSTRLDLLESILAHELAHARRFDHLVNLAQRLVESFFFFHPAVHWLSRSLRRQREFCADAIAVRITRDPVSLARALEAVALERSCYSKARPAGAWLGGQTSSLLPRIEELIGMKPIYPRPQVWPFLALPAAGLIAVVAATAGAAQDRGGGASAGTEANRPIAAKGHDRMISYEVRYMSLDAEPWRELVQDKLKLVKQEADVCAWIIDEKDLVDILTLAQSDISSNVLQSPKTIGRENVPVSLANADKQHYVAQMEKIASPENIAYRPIVKEIDIGIRMDLNGSIQARGTRLSVDLRDKELLAMHSLRRKDRLGDRIIAATYQVPTSVERRCRLVCEIPDGCQLVISLGLHERRGRSSNSAEAASGLLQLVGLPPVPARSVTCERLVVIKLRPIAAPAGRKE